MATAPLPRRRALRCQATVTVLILFFFPALRVAKPQTPANLPQLISMEDAVRIALAYNQSLRAQRLNIDQSKAEEITAPLKPNPTLHARWSIPFRFSRRRSIRFNTQIYEETLSYTVERGGKRRNASWWRKTTPMSPPKR